MLILSQENACVESGFSMNEQMLEANMKEHSSVARRIVYGRVRGRWYSESGYKDENARSCPEDVLKYLNQKTGSFRLVSEYVRRKERNVKDLGIFQL